MSKISLHCQGHEWWLQDYINKTGCAWIKFVNTFPVLQNVSLIGRVRAMDEAEQNLLVVKGEAGAVEFYGRVRPEMDRNRHVALWEGPNEVSIWNSTVLAGLYDFYQRLIQLHHADGFRLMAGQFNVGWPYLPTDDGGTQSATCGRAIQGADAVGFHEYDPENLTLGLAHKTMCRYKITTDYWRSLGLTVPPVFITECGLDGPGDVNYGHVGWKTILDNNLEEYVRQLCWYEAQLQADPQVEAATIFSVITDWTDFALDQNQCMYLADELNKVKPEPKPEPTERAKGLYLSKYQEQVTQDVLEALWDDGYRAIGFRVTGPNNIDYPTYTEVDPIFTRWYSTVKEMGFLTYGFHYLHPDLDEQAKTFAAAVKDKKFELGLWGDVEYGSLDANRCARFFRAADRETGETVNIYGRKNQLDIWRLSTEPEYELWQEERKLWLAAWTNDLAIEPNLPITWQDTGFEWWQWTNSAYLPETNQDRVCLDAWRGTTEELLEEYGEQEEGNMENVGFADVEIVGLPEDQPFDTFWGVNMKRFAPIGMPEGATYYKLVRLAWREGWCGCAVKVVDENWIPIQGEQVFQGWDNPDKKLPDNVAPLGGQPDGYPNTGTGGFTDSEGNIGFGWGSGEWFDPTKVEGPHWYWRGGENGAYSDVSAGHGWWDEHEVLEPTFMKLTVGEGPEPPEPEGILEEIRDAILAIATDVHATKDWLYRS